MNDVMLGAMMLGGWEILLILLVFLFWVAVVGGIVFLVIWLVRRGDAQTIKPASHNTKKFSFVEIHDGSVRVRWGFYFAGLVGLIILTGLINGFLMVAGVWSGMDTVLFGTLAAVVAFNVCAIYQFTKAGKGESANLPAAEPLPISKPTPAASTPSTCPRCGTQLPADSPQGLCPRCVMGVGLATQTEATGKFGPHGTKIVPPPQADVARRFPHLDILDCLGHGGMGVVYKARQPKLNRLVALKILAPEKGADPKFAERFLREAQALARLSHPNIVTVHDFGEADGMFYLLMEYVDGATLRQLLREGRMKPETALTIVPKICEALQFAHEQGIVHRDIKPENVLLDKQGRVKIADFGIAKMIAERGCSSRSGTDVSGASEQSQTSTAKGSAAAGTAALRALTQDHVLGTPHYMAPEQVEHPQTVDHRADIYSLGVVFYEMLTGELPLGKFQPPSKKVQVDVRLDEVVLHALEKEPERRYQHVSEVKCDVETIAEGSASLPPVNRQLPVAGSAKPAHQSVKTAHKILGGFWTAICTYFFTSLVLGIYESRPDRFDTLTIDLFFVFLYFTGVVAGFRALSGARWARIVLSVVALLTVIASLLGLFAFFNSLPYSVVGIAFDIFALMSAGVFLTNGKPFDAASNETPGARALPIAELERARHEVKHPASWLMATGILNWIAIPFIVMVILPSASRSGGASLPAVLALLAALFLSSAMILAGLKMKRLEAYSLAIMGSILAIFITPGNIIGLPVGIWCLVALFRRDVREAFGKARMLSDGPAQPKGAGAWKVAFRIIIALAVVIGALLLLVVSPTFNDLKKVRQRAEVIGSVEKETNLKPHENRVATEAAAFGLVHEIKLHDADVQPEALDFETGRILALPQEVKKQVEANNVEWFIKSGADLLTDEAPEGVGLITIRSNELKLVKLANEEWQSLTPSELNQALSRGVSGLTEDQVEPFGKVYILPPDTPAPVTLGFRTGGGAEGILQLVRFGGGRQSPASLQYKLVQSLPPLAQAPLGQYFLTLSNGVKIEVVAVTRNPLENKTWWKPDGTPLSQPPGERVVFQPLQTSPAKVNAGEDDHAVLVRYSWPTGAETPMSQTRYLPTPQQMGFVEIQQGDVVAQTVEELKRWQRMLTGGAGGPKASSTVVGYANVMRFPAGTQEATVLCAAAVGPWEPVATFDGQRTEVLIEGAQVLCTSLRRERKGKCLDVSHNVDREHYALRMMGVLKNGERQELNFHSGVLRAPETQGYVLLEPDQRVEDIAEFVLERTPWVRGEIPSVMLTPRAGAAAQSNRE